MANLTISGNFSTGSEGWKVDHVFNGVRDMYTVTDNSSPSGFAGLVMPDSMERYGFLDITDPTFVTNINVSIATSHGSNYGDSTVELRIVNYGHTNSEVPKLAFDSVFVPRDDWVWRTLSVNYSPPTPTEYISIMLHTGGDATYFTNYVINLEYPDPTSTYCKDAGVWKPSDKYVKENGIWKPAETSVKHNGVFKSV